MSRSTIKQQNSILDEIKNSAGLKSRKAAYDMLYSQAGEKFKQLGFSISHYKDGCLQITSNHIDYYTISIDDIFTPRTTVRKIQSLPNRLVAKEPYDRTCRAYAMWKKQHEC